MAITRGKDMAEKSMLTAAKRNNMEGFMAAPLAELKHGKPHSFTWLLGSAKSKAEGASMFFADHKFKWSGPASLLYPAAPEEAVLRFATDLRSVKWLPNGWSSRWQSAEELGGAFGTRSAKRQGTSTTLGRFAGSTDSEIGKYGHPDFPIR